MSDYEFCLCVAAGVALHQVFWSMFPGGGWRALARLAGICVVASVLYLTGF